MQFKYFNLKIVLGYLRNDLFITIILHSLDAFNNKKKVGLKYIMISLHTYQHYSYQNII